MDTFSVLAAAVQLDGGLKTVAITIAWIVAVGLGFWEYARSKGRIGRALMVALGGGMLLTFLVSPDILTSDIPEIFGNVIDWLTDAAK